VSLGLFVLSGCGAIDSGAPASPALMEQSPPAFDTSGFVDSPGRDLVTMHCTGCHSGKLVQQNRATRPGWAEIIRWMQKKQGLWKLEANVEERMLDYLAAAYGPETEADGERRPRISADLMPPAANQEGRIR